MSLLRYDKNHLWWTVRVIVAVGATIFLLTSVSFEQLEKALTGAKLEFVAVALLAQLLARLVGTMRLREFTAASGHTRSLVDLFRINLASDFYRLFIPGGNVTAGAARVYRFRHLDVPVASGSAVVVRDRIDATLFLVITGMVFLVIDTDWSGLPMMVFVALGMIATVLLAVVIESPLARLLDRLMDRLDVPVVGPWLMQGWRTLRQTGSIPGEKHLFVAVLSIVAHLLGTAAYLSLATSLGIDLTFFEMGWIRPLVLLLTMVPVSLGGVGVREAGFLTVLSQLGVEAELSLALSFLVFLVTVLVFGIIGGVSEGIAHYFGWSHELENAPRSKGVNVEDAGELERETGGS